MYNLITERIIGVIIGNPKENLMGNLIGNHNGNIGGSLNSSCFNISSTLPAIVLHFLPRQWPIQASMFLAEVSNKIA